MQQESYYTIIHGRDYSSDYGGMPTHASINQGWLFGFCWYFISVQ